MLWLINMEKGKKKKKSGLLTQNWLTLTFQYSYIFSQYNMYNNFVYVGICYYQ